MRMRLRAIGGPLVIALWQVAPVQTVQDSLGRTRITFGYGGGAFESDVMRTDCDGNQYYESLTYRAQGVRVDTWPHDRIRLTGFATQARYDAEAPDVRYDRTSANYGGEVALEAQYFGVGVGFARAFRYSGTEDRPSYYLRLGDIDRAHFRFDLLAPNATHGSTGYWRLGVGSNTGHVRGASLFGGLSICHFCGEHSRVGVFAEGVFPTGSWIDIVGESRFSAIGDLSMGVGARVSF